jgi:hypothetical protein
VNECTSLDASALSTQRATSPRSICERGHNRELPSAATNANVVEIVAARAKSSAVVIGVAAEHRRYVDRTDACRRRILSARINATAGEMTLNQHCCADPLIALFDKSIRDVRRSSSWFCEARGWKAGTAARIFAFRDGLRLQHDIVEYARRALAARAATCQAHPCRRAAGNDRDVRRRPVDTRIDYVRIDGSERRNQQECAGLRHARHRTALAAKAA